MYIVEESGSATCRSTVPESSDLEVYMQHIDLPHLYNSSINGHAACPKWAQPVSKMCPKRFKDETPEKGMKNHQSPDDTSMILQ